MPLPNSRQPLHRVADGERRSRSGRRALRLPALGQPLDARTLPVERHRPHHPARRLRPSIRTSLATLQDFMVSHTYMFSPNAINQVRFSINKIDAEPAVTCGLTNVDYGINVANTNPLAVGLPSFAITGFFRRHLGARRPAAAVREARQPRAAAHRRLHLDRGQHSLKFGLDVRHEHMIIAFINRPNGDFTFSGSSPATPRPTSCSGSPRSSAPPPRRRSRTARLAVRRLRAGRVPRHVAAHPESRPALRTADAVRRERRITGFRPGQQSTVLPQRPHRSRLPRRRGHSARHRTDGQEQLRAAPVGWPGIRSATARRASARRVASSTTRSPARATSSRAACWRRPSRR